MLECMLFLFLTQECILLPSYFSFSPGIKVTHDGLRRAQKVRGSECGKECCRWRQRDGGDVTCGKWQWGLWPLGAVPSDGNVSWHVRAGPCTTLRLLSTSARVNRVHSKWQNEKNAKNACNEGCSHTYPNDARIC